MHDIQPMINSTGLLADPAALRARAEADGYLFFKGLLDPAKIFEVRRQMVEVLVRHGYVDAGDGVGRERVIRAAVDAQPKERVIEQCMTVELYDDVQKLEVFHALPHEPALLAVYEMLFQERPLPHPRNVARVIMPGSSFFPTPPHQDFPLIQGALDTWTCWIPLGDAPRSLGPLTLMPGSHKHGVFDTVTMPGAGATGAKIGHLEPNWVSTDFEAGDLVTFSSLTVHRALPQEDRELVRLSLDARYQPASQPIQHLSLRPHAASYMAFAGLNQSVTLPGWEEIYAGWSSDALKYYWREFDLRLTGFDLAPLAFSKDLRPEQRAVIKARTEDTRGLLVTA